MSLKQSRCSDLDSLFKDSGVVRYAIVRAAPVSEAAVEQFGRWVDSGCNAGMDYLRRHSRLRTNPENLLAGVRSVVCCAVPYPSPLHLPPRKAKIAAYALGDDYHEVVRDMLSNVADRIKELYGGETRVCVDTAPLPERYWAVRSGLGFFGLNGHMIIPGLGSFFFLGEILTTAMLPETLADGIPADCGRCGRCVKACPAGALRGDGTVDARRCLSYLTIEHRGEFPSGTDLHGCLYGCDVCGMVCPHNVKAPNQAVSPRLSPRPGLLSLSLEDALGMDQARFSGIFSHSAVKRAKLDGLRRNARELLDEE